MLTKNTGIILLTDTPNTPRDKRFMEMLKLAWDNDIVIVCAAGNSGVGSSATTLDLTTPQRLGTDTNPLITVGGAISNGSLWYNTTPFDPPPNFVPETLPGFGTLTGGSMTVYAQALNVRTSISGSGDYKTGTSFASPQVVCQIGDYTLQHRIC
jgi:hypothetical protein